MKICIINHSDVRGGASVVARRLMHALRALGHDAYMLVARKESDDEFVFAAASPYRVKIPFLAEHLRLFAACGFSKKDIFKVSIATDGLPLSRHPLVRQADAVILNWVNQGMLSLGEIGRIAAAKKTVWTMHDMWNMTAVCHHAGKCTQFASEPSCGACPMLSLKSVGKRAASRKNSLYGRVPLRFVAVSTWLAQKAAESALMRNIGVEVIPNAFPVDEFYMEPKRGRAVWALPEDKKIIVMGAARLDDPVKGLDYAVEALNKLGRKSVVAVFYGALKNPDALSGLKVPHVYLGTLSQADIRELFACADVVMSSSLYESLPGTLVEGMAAGCTPVAFDSGGQCDIITDKSVGYLVPPYDTDAFAAALAAALDSPVDAAVLCRHVREKFSADAVAERYLKLLR